MTQWVMGCSTRWRSCSKQEPVRRAQPHQSTAQPTNEFLAQLTCFHGPQATLEVGWAVFCMQSVAKAAYGRSGADRNAVATQCANENRASAGRHLVIYLSELIAVRHLWAWFNQSQEQHTSFCVKTEILTRQNMGANAVKSSGSALPKTDTSAPSSGVYLVILLEQSVFGTFCTCITPPLCSPAGILVDWFSLRSQSWHPKPVQRYF